MAVNCEHPVECRAGTPGEDDLCEWCEEVDGLRKMLGEIRGVIGKTAYTVPPGCTLICTGDVGLLECYGGTVQMAGPTVAEIAKLCVAGDAVIGKPSPEAEAS
jgi:hypothetical protein